MLCGAAAQHASPRQAARTPRYPLPLTHVYLLPCVQIGWPASILNLFWGVLIWKREAEKALESSGMAYTILRPGGMERPTDAYKNTHNLVLSPKNTTFGGQVSRLQVAELVGAVLDNPELSANKWVVWRARRMEEQGGPEQ